MTVNATEVKNRFGRYLQMAITNPVIIEKNSNPVAVMLSNEEYERLINLENVYWAEKAAKSEKEGYIGEKESLKIIRAGGRVKT